MHRIDSFGATEENLFTEGNPAEAIPATRVSDDWANDVQEELCNLIEGEGITLVKGTQTQLQAAVRAMMQNFVSTQAIGNNQTDQDVTALVFDGSPASGLGVKSVHIEYDIHRKDDGQELTAMGSLILLFKPGGDTWTMVGPDEAGEDCGFTISIDDTAGVCQVQYSTTNFGGANYEGTLTFKVKKFTYAV